MKDLGIDVESEFIFDRNGVIRNFDEIEEIMNLNSIDKRIDNLGKDSMLEEDDLWA